MLALVWIAGPLSGALVQPYVGMKSDNCRISWGRRRPFIIGGALATILCLMTLAWAREIMSGFLSLFGADPESWGVKTAVMVFAILFVYVLDFAINVSEYYSWATTTGFTDSACSPSRHSSLHRRRCAYSSAGIRQCLDDQGLGHGQHHGLSRWKRQSTQISSLAR